MKFPMRVTHNAKKILTVCIIVSLLYTITLALAIHFYRDSQKYAQLIIKAEDNSTAALEALAQERDSLKDQLKHSHNAVEQAHYTLRKLKADCTHCVYTFTGDNEN